MPRNSARRANRGRQPRRTARKHNAVATRNNVVTTRIFRGTQSIFLQTANDAQGGLESPFAFTSGIGNYPGSSYISNNHEQYRVTNVKILAKPSIGNLAAPQSTQDAIRFQNLIYGICNQTEMQSFVDYDSQDPPTSYTQVLQRPNLKIRALSPTQWTMIGSFAPRATSNPSGGTSASRVYGPQEWLTTQNLDTALHGLRGYATCRCPAFTISGDTAYPVIDIILVATVQMRGNKNEDTSLGGLARVGPRDFRDEDEPDENSDFREEDEPDNSDFREEDEPDETN